MGEEKLVVNRYGNMYTKAFRDVCEHCDKCEIMQNAIEKKKNNTLNAQELGDLRVRCTNCKNCKNGIFKADAILSAMLSHKELQKIKQKRNVGKKPVIAKKFGTAITNLADANFNYEQIAEMLGICPNSVRKFLNDNNLPSAQRQSKPKPKQQSKPTK